MILPTVDEHMIRALLGTPYRAEGQRPTEGFSCWSLVRYLYAQIGLPLPLDVWQAGRFFVPAVPPYQPMDVAVFRLIPGRRPHVGCMLQAPRFVQCSLATNGVACSEITRDFWRQSFVHCLRHREQSCA